MKRYGRNILSISTSSEVEEGDGISVFVTKVFNFFSYEVFTMGRE
jgi:hypothetical protein